MKIGILGSGAWGLALGNILAENGNDVMTYSRSLDVVYEINRYHTHRKVLGDCILNSGLIASIDLKEVIGEAEIVLIAVPSKAVKDMITELNKVLDHKVLIVNATKGLDLGTNMTMQKLIKANLKKKLYSNIVSILGPSFANEVVRHNLTCVCSCCSSLEVAKEVQVIFSNNYFRVYAMDDVIGAEIYSSMKNAIAIASGISKGLGYGENSKAALITRGLVEMQTVGKAVGAKEKTFFGLTGLGDLILTANSSESRNFTAGFTIGKNNGAKEFLKNNTVTVEGIATVKVIYDFAKENSLDLPIISALYDVLYNEKVPSDEVIHNLMIRDLKVE
jgi:glycerol-3-phosphate dehydrogenase (NAD(P)+)